MATALLISMNMNAVTVSDEAGLRSAIEKQGDGSLIEVTLGDNINLVNPIFIYSTYFAFFYYIM